MKAEHAHLAKMAQFSNAEVAHVRHSGSLEEPYRGREGMKRLLAAIDAGKAEASDVWPFLIQHLHHENPNAQPRMRGAIEALVERALAPRVTTTAEAA